MRSRSIVIAITAVTTLILASCSTSISGSALAADPIPASADVDSDGLTLPSDSDEIPGLGELLEGLTGEDGEGPDLGSLLGDGGEGGEGPDLGDLLGNLTGEGGLGEVPGLADIMGEDCLAVAGATVSLGMLLMGAAMGSPLTEDAVESAFASLSGLPEELAPDVEALHQAALAAVGDSSAATALMSDPAVEAAMDHISSYLDEKCGPAE